MTEAAQFEVTTLVRSITLVYVLTRGALIPSVTDLKVLLMNVQRCLIWECMPQEFELDHDIREITVNICCTKNEGEVDHSPVRRWMKFHSVSENVENQVRSTRSKSNEYEAVLQSI